MDEVVRPAASRARKAAHARDASAADAMNLEGPEEVTPPATASTQPEQDVAQPFDRSQTSHGEASDAGNPPANDNVQPVVEQQQSNAGDSGASQVVQQSNAGNLAASTAGQQQSNAGNLAVLAPTQASASTSTSQHTVSSQGRQPVIKHHASSKRRPSDNYPGPRDPHDPEWHEISSRRYQRDVGFEGNPQITLGALNHWVMLQGHLQTLGVFEIEAPTLSERLRYRHHRVMLELVAKELEDVEGVDDLGD
ncbi:MAG: hypothetical protein Q9208_003352 [Pyrenodesmia sp. 3 TL-2023]